MMEQYYNDEMQDDNLENKDGISTPGFVNSKNLKISKNFKEKFSVQKQIKVLQD